MPKNFARCFGQDLMRKKYQFNAEDKHKRSESGGVNR